MYPAILALLDRYTHTSVMLGHWDKHIVIICQILFCRILEVHVW